MLIKCCVLFYLNCILCDFVHFCVLPSFTEVVFVPLIKDKSKSIDNINNYRPIVLVLIASKLFESCISEYICNFLHTCNNQLSVCTWKRSKSCYSCSKNCNKVFFAK